ncbi:MAG: glycosyl transferase [Anaerolineae bacterium]|nr:glycosyl transferase [Anaerolineae bacterium]
MSKTVFFNIPASGHINPSLPIVAEMVRRGERVLYINTEETRSQIEPSGVTFIPYPTLPELENLMKRANNGNLAGNALALAEIGERLLPFTLELLQREKPDYVIFDSLAAWGKQAAGKLGIPAAASIVTFVLGYGVMPPVSPGVAFQMISEMARRLPAYWQIARRTRNQFGVKPVGLINTLMNYGDISLVYTSVEFQPNGARFPSSYRFVGPPISQRSSTIDFPYEQITRRPVIYISLGTINNENLDFYRQCFAAFGNHPGQFILSVGNKINLADLGTIPSNFIVRNFVPQMDVLQRSDVFVTHGGMNSVHEGLFYGLPLVVIPQQAEQAMVAGQVAKFGAGVALGTKPPLGQVSAAELWQAVDHVLRHEDSYCAAAAALGDTFRAAGGYLRAADALITFGQNGRGKG